MIRIGNLKLKSDLLLAPMSGVSDYCYREIVKKFEPALVFSEMIASRALVEKNKKTLKMIKKDSSDVYAIQIAGCEPNVMGEAAKLCQNSGADIIDINMGCPVKKVVNGYAGSALMKDEKLASRIIKSVVSSVDIPVTLKMRKGWDEKSLNAPDLAKIAENEGVKMITVHGRTRNQMFKGNADWSFVKKVKKVTKKAEQSAKKWEKMGKQSEKNGWKKSGQKVTKNDRKHRAGPTREMARKHHHGFLKSVGFN